MATFVELRRAEKEFGMDGLMMAVDTRNGVYGCLSVLNESANLLERWLRTERDSLHIRNSVTAPSSAALILQIWLHLSLRAFTESQKLRAYESQGHKCPLCVANGIYTEYAFEDMEGDHIIPWSKGGHTTDNNLQMLCKKCNAAKSDK